VSALHSVVPASSCRGAEPLRVHTPAELLTANMAPRLASAVVDVWAYKLSADAALLDRVQEWLVPDERVRAARFVYERDRHAFIVGRAILRLLLGRYLNKSPVALEFAYGTAGKPTLATASDAPPPLQFNLSHSADRAVLAVTWKHAIGVDIERRGRPIDVLAIANRYFFGAEFDAIAAASPADRQAVFLQYWVAKEAVLKAEGIGIGFALDRFSICFTELQDRATVTTHKGRVPDSSWQVRRLDCDVGWHAALAIPGNTLELHFPSCDG